MEASMEGGSFEFKSSEETVARMTHDEAQAVIELWAQRRKAAENEASMPTALELSEALNVPRNEVEELLVQVRNSRTPKEAVAKNKLRTSPDQRAGIIKLAIIAAAIVAMCFLAFLTQTSSQSKLIPQPDAPTVAAVDTAITPPASAPTAEVTIEASDISLPAGLSIAFDGTAMHGTRPFDATQYTDIHLQNSIESSMKTFVSQVSKAPSGGENLIIESEVLVQALLDEKTSVAPSTWFVWRSLTIRSSERSLTYQIPICVNVQDKVKKAVALEQARRITRAASQAVELIRGRSTGK